MSALLVHHLENSRSQRLLWLLEELNLEYRIERYARTPAGRAPASLLEIHPLGKSPVLEHDGVRITESGAIIEYVLDEFGEGRMRPKPGTDAFRRYRFFLHFAEGSMMAPLLVKLIFNRVRKAVPLLGGIIANKVDANFTDPEIHSHLGFVETELNGREWIADDEPTGADVMMFIPVLAALARNGGADRYPNVAAYLHRIQARPAYARALERGGPFKIT